MELIEEPKSSFLLPKSFYDLHRESSGYRYQGLAIGKKPASNRIKVISSWESIQRIRKQW